MSWPSGPLPAAAPKECKFGAFLCPELNASGDVRARGCPHNQSNRVHGLEGSSSPAQQQRFQRPKNSLHCSVPVLFLEVGTEQEQNR
uniref:Uncharacterized protein n=1 Tax=Globodera pallida TaxID=36090 RepID=A0A183BP62_GLOPA